MRTLFVCLLLGTAASLVHAQLSGVQQFGSAVLAAIGAPASANNLGAFSAWTAGEGACAAFNPLDTTQPESGAWAYNSFGPGGQYHVWNYPSFAVGVQATVTALTNGRYGPILTAFRNDAGVAAIESAVAASPWGTHVFGSTSYTASKSGTNFFSNGGSSPPTNPPTPSPSGGSCVAFGVTGTCMDTSACAAGLGFSTAGLCSGPSNIQCCTPPQSCNAGGVAGWCFHTELCAGAYGTSHAGLCAGPADIQCCTANPPCTAGGVNGACIDTGACSAQFGRSTPGLCAGPTNIQCCTQVPCSVGSTAGVCVQTALCAEVGRTSHAGVCPGPVDEQCCI